MARRPIQWESRSFSPTDLTVRGSHAACVAMSFGAAASNYVAMNLGGYAG